ncbi:class I glutamine amidotransferase-like protein [Schizophyllum commune]
MSSPSLSVAVCMYNRMTSLDYQGPIEFLSALSAKTKPYMFKEKADSLPTLGPFTYLSHTLEPVAPGYAGEAGPRLTPDKTFGEAKEQFDIIMVPGGIPEVPQELNDFLIRQVPGAKYVLTICTGSWVLARTGLLDGKRATGNKFVFKEMMADTASHNIEWVARARWVVDGKFWTSSGVTAGADMASAFVTQIADEATAQTIQNIIEMRAKGQDDDEFAALDTSGSSGFAFRANNNHPHVHPTPDACSFPRPHISDAKIERLVAHRTRNGEPVAQKVLIASKFSVFLIHAFTEGRAQDVRSHSVEHSINMARTYWIMGSTGKFVPGRLQNDIWFNKRCNANGRPQVGAQRLCAQCAVNRRVLLFLQIYLFNPLTGMNEWMCHFLPPPIIVTDFGLSPSAQPPPPANVNPAWYWITDRWNPPLPGGAPRPPALARGYAIDWHHKNMARVRPGRRMYYFPHKRSGTSYVARIKIPAAAKDGSFRRVHWNTQVQNWRARSKY